MCVTKILTCTIKTSAPGAQQCCLPNEFNGKLIYSFPGENSDYRQGSSQDVELKFGVDYINHRVVGEHDLTQATGQQRRFEFLAETKYAKSMVIRERLAKTCWKVALGDVLSDRCSVLNKAQYRGEMTVDRRGLATAGIALGVKA